MELKRSILCKLQFLALAFSLSPANFRACRSDVPVASARKRVRDDEPRRDTIRAQGSSILIGAHSSIDVYHQV
ncbi:hypothetical protein DFH11DRAFT_1600083 [Phellopilus nigrolimitatus]|nr:hypothetical protein DFH11DRAFT_1600083 [Phellopilus nigrolimitatus]